MTGVLTTAEDLFQSSADYGRCELVRGEVIRMSPAGGEHGGLVVRMSRVLDLYVEPRNIGLVFAAETGIVVATDPDTVRGADGGFISYRRLGRRRLPKGFLTVPPEIVVEVVLPTDRWSDIEAKVGDCLAFGVDLVWVVDPGTERVHVHRTGRGIEVFGIDDTLTAEPILPEFSCSVRRIFQA